MKKENDIQRDICHYLRKQGHLFWRFSPETYKAKLGIHVKSEWLPNGLPDTMLINKEEYGQLWGLECKRPKGGKASPAQIIMKKRFELNNARYEFVTSVEDVKKLGL
jgi:hypothetical protein